ncbi:ATP-binding cassette domain-containing protein [Streptomyces sp. RG80]|uniref:ATP-binding cassette domain-containing protein n=1 Tax=Streptomyces sp. RG80 TaxID=3157340 RepID=UPI00338DBCB4
MDETILVDGVAKSFRETPALRQVNLEVSAGTVFGLLGPNGAGKTTLVRILTTLEQPDAGRALVDGHDVVRQARQVRRTIGLTGQYVAVDEEISGQENLYLVGRLLNLRPKRARARADELLEQFGLADAATRTTKGYSGGMRRRLDLAASLVGEPRVLFLDEPTTGLDPRSRNALWEIVRSMADQGVTVLLTTQYMDEAEALADTVAVLDHGEIIERGSPAELRSRVGGQVLYVRPLHEADTPEVVRVLAGVGVTTAVPKVEAGMVRLPLSGELELNLAIRALGTTQVPVAAIETRVPSLDEVFLTLTGTRPGAGAGDEEAGGAGDDRAAEDTRLVNTRGGGGE